MRLLRPYSLAPSDASFSYDALSGYVDCWLTLRQDTVRVHVYGWR